MRYLRNKSKLQQLQKEERVMDPLLLAGAYFTKHGLKGVHRRFIRCDFNYIYWLSEAESPLTECVDPIEWNSVVDILQGKQTLMFSRSSAMDVPDSVCLSIVYRSDGRTLDLAADNNEQAYEWFHALWGYFVELRDKFAAELELKMRVVQTDLHRQREVQAEERKHLEENLKLSAEELEKHKSFLDEQKASVTQERDQLMSRVQELSAQAAALREEIDSQLKHREDMLLELRDYATVPSQIEKLKKEKMEENVLLKKDMEDLAQLLTLSINPKWSEFSEIVTNDAQKAITV